MVSFNDKGGTAWDVDINVAAVKRVRKLVDVDLLNLSDGKLLEILARDEVKLVDVIYALCEPQAKERNVTDEQFGAAMGGLAIDHAYDAFLKEMVNFFRSPAQRRVMSKALEKLDKLMLMAYDAAEKRLDSGEAEDVMEAAIEKHRAESLTPGKPSTSSPESPA